MITTGYAFAPNGQPGSIAISFDPTLPANAGLPGSVQLTQVYYPVNYSTGLDGSGLGGQRDFGAGVGVPYRLIQGSVLRCPKGEAAALIAAGVAVPV